MAKKKGAGISDNELLGAIRGAASRLDPVPQGLASRLIKGVKAKSPARATHLRVVPSPGLAPVPHGGRRRLHHS